MPATPSSLLTRHADEPRTDFEAARARRVCQTRRAAPRPGS
jgi:hypothetical protein